MGNYSSERKKMTNVYILEILKKYTDDTCDKKGNPAHCLTQKQIRDKLIEDYEIDIDRKAVARGLDDLINSSEYYNKIEFDTEPRKVSRSDESTEKKTNFRYIHDFDSAQIRLLMEAVLFSRNISEKECQALLEKISSLGDINSRSRLSKHLSKLSIISNDKVANEQLLNNIDVIDEAIESGKQIAYIYNNYGKDKKLHPKLDPDGNPLLRIVNPYSIQVSDGRFYLICNYDEYDNATYARIDKITNIEILDTPSKDKSKVSGLNDKPATLAEQLYMLPGKSERIIFKVSNSESIISELIDWFGKSIKFTNEDDKYVRCEIKANPQSMRYWAMQYSDYVEVLEPESLRDEIKNGLRSAWRKYNNTDSLAESNEEIQNLISEWHEISEKAKSRNEEDRKIDIKALGSLTKRTYNILQPFFGKNPEGPYAHLILELDKIGRFATHVLSDSHCISLIAYTLTNMVKYGERIIASGIPENTLQITIRKAQREKTVINIELDNFEEDYLTLKQYTDEKAEESRKFHEEFYKKIREKRKTEAEQRRKERESQKKK